MFGDKLKRLREANNLSQQQLAEKLDMSPKGLIIIVFIVFLLVFSTYFSYFYVFSIFLFMVGSILGVF